MNRSGWITLATLATILLLVFFYYQSVQKQNQVDELERSPAATALSADVPYTDIEGNPVQLSDFVGQDIIVFAWASWCPSCVQQLQLLGEVAAEDESLSVLAINRAEPIPTAISFLEFYDLTNTVQLIMDPTDHFFASVDGFSMPETVIFNKQGAVVHHERGPITREELLFILDSLPE